MPDARYAARLSRDLVLRTGAGAADGALRAAVIGGLEVAVAARSDAPHDLRSLLRAGPARLDARARAGVVSFLAPLAAEPGSDAAGLGAALRLVRDALRERLPVHGRRLQVHALVAVAPPLYVLVTRGPAARAALTVVSPEGARVPLGASDGAVVLEIPALGTDGWVVEGEDFEVWAPPVIERPGAAWAALLAGAWQGSMAGLAPVLAALERRVASEAAVTEISDHGPPGGETSVSIVVALHHRLDLLEHQLAAFAADPEARATELVYVIDGPGIAEPARRAVPALADLYRMRIRLVVLGAPGGRAVALDAGASNATGHVLVLMGGDVLPAGAGWLSALAAAGLPAAPVFADAHGARCAPSGGDEPCLMVRADAFHRAGGFGARYPGGSGAAADLLRRLDHHGGVLTRVEEVVLHWLRGADEPTITPEARRYAAWLRMGEGAPCPNA